MKTTPYAHQRDEFNSSLGLDPIRRGLWWEMGCGKTKPVIDVTAEQFTRGAIDGLLVLAPSGVHRNWVVEEIPTHLDVDVAAQTHMLFWSSKSAKTKKYQAEVAKLFDKEKYPFAVLTMNYEAVMTDGGRAVMKRFLEQRTCVYVLDESQYIKTPGAKRTKRILASAKYARHRWCLSGTPVDNSPFDVFTQVKFLDPTAWHPYGCSTFAAFKAFFGVWDTMVTTANGRAREFPVLKFHRNLDRLHEVVDRVGTRLVKTDVLDLPPKSYVTRPFEMNPEQVAAYKDLKLEFMTWLDSGETVTAALAIVRMTRLQQITSGFIGTDDETLVPLGKTNPRILCLSALLGEIAGKAIIFAKFRYDIDQIMELLGSEAVRYDGEVGEAQRGQAIERFQRGDATYFVANPAAAGTGLTLHAANNVVYYNNSYKLGQRLQSEDRAHRIGQEHPVTYHDIVGIGTLDLGIATSLRRKRKLAEQVMGDEIRTWL